MSSVASARIRLFHPKFRVDETLDAIRACLESGWTGPGARTRDVEEQWRAYTGLKHAVFMNSATAALHTAIAVYKRLHGWRDGDEIISTPLTFVSTNHAVLYEDMRVTFADVDESGCLDPDDIERKLRSSTRAVMFVGLAGNSGQLPRVAEICRRRGIVLILDAAHMAGTRVAGQDPGHLADAVCYSFHALKNLPTFDAGMLCLSDDRLAEWARQFAWMGISEDTFARATGDAYRWRYEIETLGRKYHGNAIAAAIAMVGLKYLDDDNEHRRMLAAGYDEAFAGCPNVRPLPIAADCEPSRLFYQVAVNNREHVIDALQRAGIACGVHYRDNTEYPMYAYGHGTCPRAHRLSRELLTLPLHLHMNVEDVRHVTKAVIAAAG